MSCSGTKVPRVSLYNAVRNKQLVVFTGTESVILADVVASLGHKLARHDQLSVASCLTCARTLTRIYGTFVKLVRKSNDGIPVTSKRLSSNSPTGVSPLAKRTRESGVHSTRRSLAFTPSQAENEIDENVEPLAGITALNDKWNQR